MGRRALRPIDPNLELAEWLLELEQVPRPATAPSLFGRDAPLEVEVGSGKGLFLRTAAAAHPDRCFLGAEVGRKYARFTAAGLAKRGLTNAKVVAGDALRLLAEWLPDESLAAVHVYFPDPWWKKRHRKRRVMRPSFARDVERVLEPGGVLHFWTDVAEYFADSLEILAACGRLEGPLPVDETPAEHDMDYRTHFERRVRRHRGEVFRGAFRKT